MRSSDTQENDRELERHAGNEELRGPQGPADWSRQPRSDDLLSPATRDRLEELRDRGAELEHERDAPGP
jgi:hypothetical protein